MIDTKCLSKPFRFYKNVTIMCNLYSAFCLFGSTGWVAAASIWVVLGSVVVGAAVGAGTGAGGGIGSGSSIKACLLSFSLIS